MIPALRALRARYPDRPLHFAGNLDHAVLLERYGVVDRALSSEDLALWRGRAPAGYRLVVSGQPLSVAEAGQQVVVFDPRPEEGCGVPASAQLLGRLGLGTEVSPVPSLVERLAPPAPGAAVWLHPGAGSVRKCWPVARWCALAGRLRGASRAVVLVLGPVELERGLRVELPEGCELRRAPPLPELAIELAGAAAFAGHDSGVTHLAAALGVPTVAVFGPTDPAVWAPLGEHVTVVASDGEGSPRVTLRQVATALERATGPRSDGP